MTDPVPTAYHLEADMASVEITRQWPDGDILNITIEADNSYPDALDEATTTAVRCYREALGISVASVEDTDEP